MGKQVGDQGIIWVRRSFPKREGLAADAAEFYTERWFPSKEDAVQDVHADVDGSKLARVKVGLGMTLNLGNYESARVDVGIDLPCLPGEVMEAYGLAWDAVEHEIGSQVRELRGRRG